MKERTRDREKSNDNYYRENGISLAGQTTAAVCGEEVVVHAGVMGERGGG